MGNISRASPIPPLSPKVSTSCSYPRKVFDFICGRIWVKNFSRTPHYTFFSSPAPAGAWGKSSSTHCVRVLVPDFIIRLADYFLRGGTDSFPGPGVLSNSGAAIPASFHSCLFWWCRKEKQGKNLLYDIYLHILYIWRDREILIDSDSYTEIQTAAPGTTNLLPRVTKILSGASQLLKVRLVAVPAGRFWPHGLGIQIPSPRGSHPSLEPELRPTRRGIWRNPGDHGCALLRSRVAEGARGASGLRPLAFHCLVQRGRRGRREALLGRARPRCAEGAELTI